MNVCVHVCMCDGMNLSECVHVCTCFREGLGLYRLLPRRLSTFLCWDKFFFWTWTDQIELGQQPVRFRDPPVSASPKAPFLDYYLDSGDLNSCTQACMHLSLNFSAFGGVRVWPRKWERKGRKIYSFVILSPVRMTDLLFAEMFCLMVPDRQVKMELLWLLYSGKIPLWKSSCERDWVSSQFLVTAHHSGATSSTGTWNSQIHNQEQREVDQCRFLVCS